MAVRNLKPHFAKSIGATGAPLHFAAHSHHPWPDVTSDAQGAYWQESARLLDRKWERIFAHVVPTAQHHIAHHLGLPREDTICFSPNTHDFLLRILSSLPSGRPLRIITTDSEFHSFSRQIARLEEDGEHPSNLRGPRVPQPSGTPESSGWGQPHPTAQTPSGSAFGSNGSVPAASWAPIELCAFM